MRYVSIEMVTPGSILVKDIVDDKGNILLKANSGVPLRDTIISRLKEKGIKGLYIVDEISKDLNIEEAIPVTVRNLAIKALEKNYKRIIDQISILPIDNLSKSAKAKLTELTKQKENIIQEISKYKEYKKEQGNDITLSAHMIIEYGDKAWVLYAGNHNILSETYVNYNTYYEHIKYCKEKGIKIYDQFGTIGDLSKDNPRLGLHEFKKKFGGDYIEFLGEWDFVTNKLMYLVFTKLVPFYRSLIRKRSKEKLNQELNNTQKNIS